MINFKHSGSCGDVIYSLPTVISIRNENNNLPVAFYLNINMPSKNYLGSKHPLKNLRLDINYFNKLKPLLESQKYIDKVEIYQKQEINIDLDDFRSSGIDYSKGHIPRWYFYVFKANFDLSQPWINVEKKEKFKIIVNRTARYRNLNINYKFLNDYKEVTFVGNEEEFEDFKKEVPNSEFYEAEDFLELAELIAGCKLFIGNQSLCFALAESIKIPRILEVAPYASNVIPHGYNAWDCISNNAFEYISRTEIESI